MQTRRHTKRYALDRDTDDGRHYALLVYASKTKYNRCFGITFYNKLNFFLHSKAE